VLEDRDFGQVTLAAIGVSAGVIGGEASTVGFGENANSAICDELMCEIGSTSCVLAVRE